MNFFLKTLKLIFSVQKCYLLWPVFVLFISKYYKLLTWITHYFMLCVDTFCWIRTLTCQYYCFFLCYSLCQRTVSICYRLLPKKKYNHIKFLLRWQLHTFKQLFVRAPCYLRRSTQALISHSATKVSLIAYKPNSVFNQLIRLLCQS